MNLSQIGEFGLIRRIQKQLPPPFSSIPLGIGDDAAAIVPSPGKYLLLTTDTLVESVHFDFSYSTWTQVGYKAAAVNISDIAAMGGTPRFFLVSLGLTDRQQAADLDALYRGIGKGSREAEMDLIGGNIVRSKERFFISLTVLGEVPKKEMVTRGGARAGEALYVTGTPGDAAAGLEILKDRTDPKGFSRLLSRHRAPQARWREGRLLAKNGWASAMIDLSDGLTADLGHLLEQSGAGAELDLSRIPLSPPLRRYALKKGSDPVRYALEGGEDYELLFSVPERKVSMLESAVRQGAIEARRIGVIRKKKDGLTARGLDGRLTPIAPAGYDHFKRNQKRR
ncbi:MAG TPA: thiamine-phosphate kinase [Candidatus Manganitrophaceae bacterium]|nr:thiamine-phosphate kinase [Candidatus Manganitrophaceae bacterium]